MPQYFAEERVASTDGRPSQGPIVYSLTQRELERVIDEEQVARAYCLFSYPLSLGCLGPGVPFSAAKGTGVEDGIPKLADRVPSPTRRRPDSALGAGACTGRPAR